MQCFFSEFQALLSYIQHSVCNTH